MFTNFQHYKYFETMTTKRYVINHRDAHTTPCFTPYKRLNPCQPQYFFMTRNMCLKHLHKDICIRYKKGIEYKYFVKLTYRKVAGKKVCVPQIRFKDNFSTA